jgi:glycerol-3-phosphate dehydrogenase
MLERYGTYAAELLSSLPVTQHPLAHAPGPRAGAAAFATSTSVSPVTPPTKAIEVRRSSRSMSETTSSRAASNTLVEVANAAAPALGWDADETDAQVAAATETLRDAHRIDVSTASLAPQHA